MSIPEQNGWLRPEQAAAFIGIGFSTLNKMRMTASGPPFIQLGKMIWYEPEAINAWVETQRRTKSRTRQRSITPPARKRAR